MCVIICMCHCSDYDLCQHLTASIRKVPVVMLISVYQTVNNNVRRVKRVGGDPGDGDDHHMMIFFPLLFLKNIHFLQFLTVRSSLMLMFHFPSASSSNISIITRTDDYPPPLHSSSPMLFFSPLESCCISISRLTILSDHHDDDHHRQEEKGEDDDAP